MTIPLWRTAILLCWIASLHGSSATPISTNSSTNDQTALDNHHKAELPSAPAPLITVDRPVTELPSSHDIVVGKGPGRITIDPVDTTFKKAKRFTWLSSTNGISPVSPPSDTNIALINATPYRWKRVYIHSYHMGKWRYWPEYIDPGFSINHLALGFRGVGSNKDTAGEVRYELEGTAKPMSFEVRYRNRGVHGTTIWVQFLEELETQTTAKGEIINVGSNRVPGGVSFLIAGYEEDLISTSDWNTSNPDYDQVVWMQPLLPQIGDVPLRDIIMPRSHHAALTRESFKHKNTGVHWWNTVTQVSDLDTQLRKDGVRILDTRVLKHNDTFYEAHGSSLNRRWYGAKGMDLGTVVETINRFNAKYPGELIIWDIHSETWDQDRRYKPMSPADRKRFYDLVRKIDHRADLPDHADITKLPLSHFIGQNRSSVIIRFHSSWKDTTPDTFPSVHEGIVDGATFPVQSIWSEKYSPVKMANHQIEELLAHRPVRGTFLYNMQWVRTLTGITAFTLPDSASLINMGREATTMFRTYMWNRLTDNTYPNWLTIDAIEGGEIRGFMVAMNKCFVARRCGDWVREPRNLNQVAS